MSRKTPKHARSSSKRAGDPTSFHVQHQDPKTHSHLIIGRNKTKETKEKSAADAAFLNSIPSSQEATKHAMQPSPCARWRKVKSENNQVCRCKEAEKAVERKRHLRDDKLLTKVSHLYFPPFNMDRLKKKKHTFSTFSLPLFSSTRFHAARVRPPHTAHMAGTATSRAPVDPFVSTNCSVYFYFFSFFYP